jgi:ketosteroid isomerase-like protein
MSQENVEVVRRSYESYLRGDLEAALAAFDPEVETYDHDIPDAEAYRGL